MDGDGREQAIFAILMRADVSLFGAAERATQLTRNQHFASAIPLLRKRFALKISGLLATHSNRAPNGAAPGLEWPPTRLR